MNKKEIIFHIVLFVFTCGIGNVYYFYKKQEKIKYYKNKIQYYDNLKRDSIISIQTGRKLVKVTTVGGSCEKCKKWESKILIDDIFRNGSKKDGNYPLLSQAVEDGLFHNKCNHWITTYYPELEENKNSNVKIVSRKRNQKLVLLDEETGEVIEIEKD